MCIRDRSEEDLMADPTVDIVLVATPNDVHKGCLLYTSAALPDGNSLVTRGTIEGYIGWEECGSNGFGYDPIFYLYENDKSTAELSAEEKNAISHRGKALRQMKKRCV